MCIRDREYRDFVEQVKEQIQDFLPEKFADAAVEVNQIVKNNDCVLDGLMVRTEESNIAPTIYLNPYFEQIQDGTELDDVLAQIASVYQSHYICLLYTSCGTAFLSSAVS